jgi:hypothetical protein
MTISANFPSIAPSLQLNFAQTEQLDSRITFSRPTTATYYDAKTSAVAEQNLFTQSQTFDSADWGKTATSVTANSTVAPDGTTTADTVTADGTTGSKLISASNMGAGAAPATARTVSVYAKAGTNNYLQIYFSGDGTPWADFDLSLGTVGSTGSNQTASIVAAGSGWYRCILYTASTTATTCNFGIVSSSSAARAESNSLATTVILWGAQLEQRSSVTAYTATTTAAITNYIPVLLTQQANEARFDHNPTTRESLGLLIEEQRTNLVTYSSAFDNASWVKSNATIATAQTIAPDGTQTAQQFIPNNGATIGAGTNLYKQITLAAGSTATTIYAKAKELTAFTLQDGSGNGGNFNLSAGTATNVGGGVASITAVGNGWYRCIATVASSITNPYVFFYPSSGTANGYNGIYIWGAQLEAGAFATSYIPTVASQVTRSADSASMTGTNFSSWYNSGQGTLYADAISSYGSAGNWAVLTALDSGSSSYANSLIIRRTSNTTLNTYLDYNGTGVLLGGSVSASSSALKVAVSLSAGSYAQSVNGGTAATSSTPTSMIANINSLDIGYYSGTSINNYRINGTIKKIAYYPLAVTNAQLQSLTGS